VRRGRVGTGALSGNFGRAGGNGLFLGKTLAGNRDLLTDSSKPRSFVLLLAGLRGRILVFASNPQLPIEQAGECEFALADLGNIEARNLGPCPVGVDTVVKELVGDNECRQERSSRTQERRRGR
jgi:hypothetical protein